MDITQFWVLFLVMLITGAAIDYWTAIKREGEIWKKPSCLSLLLTLLVNAFFIFLYYILPAIIIVVGIRELVGLGLEDQEIDTTIISAVSKLSLLIFITDNYSDIASCFNGKISFFSHVVQALFFFPIGYFGILAITWGLMRLIFIGNLGSANISSLSADLFALPIFVPDPTLNWIIILLFYLLAALSSYWLTKSRT